MMTIILSILSLFTFFVGFCLIMIGFKREKDYVDSFFGILEIIYAVLVTIYLLQTN